MKKIVLTDQEYERIIRIRRILHQYPEISNREYKTSEYIVKELQSIEGIEFITLPLESGVVATLNGTGEKRLNLNNSEVALRSDIDAIEQNENIDSPWKSVYPGIMHACGHDCHMASLLGAAMILSRMRTQFNGQVDFIFQPAEEITCGAEEMVNAGLFERIHPQYIFGIHNWPSIPSGNIVVATGPRMAAKINFSVHIVGKGGHGSEPQNNIDPIVCAATVIESLQTIISRNMAPFQNVVLSVNSICGGNENNLVVDDVAMKVTIRAVQQQALMRAWERAVKIINSISDAYECHTEIVTEARIPAVNNNEDVYRIAHKAAEISITQNEKIINADPALASEDFSIYSQFAKTWFYWIGSGMHNQENAPLHSDCYFPDESVIPLAAKLFAASAFTALEYGDMSVI